MELYTDRLSKRELQRAANYLAVTHVTGSYPKGMHHDQPWHTTVLAGRTYDSERRRFVVKQEALPLVENHPVVASWAVLQQQGWVIDLSYMILRLRRWTISDGIYLSQRDDSRTARLNLDGSLVQIDGPEGRWDYRPLGNPGQEVRA